MLKPSLKQCIGLILLLSLIILPFWKNASNNIYEPVEINDSTIGFYQSTTCNMSLINVAKKNLQNDLNLRFNNNNYAGLECFGKVTGLDKVGNNYILSIGTNSNITIIIQSLIWILILLITSNFNFKLKEIKFIYVILLSLFFTFQQFSEDRFYLQENKYFDISMSIENYYLINIFLSFYLVLCLISLFIENNKSKILNFFPYMFIIIGSLNGFNLNFFSIVLSYIGLKAILEKKTYNIFNYIYLFFMVAWSQSRRDIVSFFDTDKLKGFINSSNNISSLFFWSILVLLIFNSFIYLAKESKLNYKVISFNLLLSSNLIVILGLLGSYSPLQNFFNYLFFGQNKRGINKLSSVDGNTWRGFSASAESIGEFYGFVILFCFLTLYLKKMKLNTSLLLLTILPFYGLYKSNNFAAILSLFVSLLGLLSYKYLDQNQRKKVFLLLILFVLIGSIFLTNNLGIEYVSTQLLYEASLHSNLFSDLSSEAKSVEITRYFDAGEIESLLNIVNKGSSSSSLQYLSQIYLQSNFNISFVPNLVTVISFLSIIINRNEMWGIFTAKYNPNFIESIFGNGPYQFNNYLYNLKLRLDVPEEKLNSLFLPHSSALDILVFFGILGIILFIAWNIYFITLSTNSSVNKLLLLFLLLNIVKSDSILYLNSVVLLAFAYIVIEKDRKIKNV